MESNTPTDISISKDLLNPDLVEQTDQSNTPQITRQPNESLAFTEQDFTDWYTRREQQRNLEEGYGATRNDPSHTPDPDTHSPSNLLNCHRMSYYKAANAPQEEDSPNGIFKFGHDFESLIEEFLREHVADSEHMILNPVHVEFEDDGLTFTGSTDPVLTDRQGNPEILFEVKTAKNLYWIREKGVRETHKAQAHAYAKGLQEKHDLDNPPQIIVIYGDREFLDVVTFEVDFDEDFWSTVTDWATEDTQYRDENALPPQIDPDSSKSFMCGYCDFKERCGGYEPDSPKPRVAHAMDGFVEIDDYWYDDTINTDIQNSNSNQPVHGFIPLTEYPEDAVISHLLTYPDVPLTPTLAMQYPNLVDNDVPPAERIVHTYGAAPQRDVSDWTCDKCGETRPFGSLGWDGDVSNPPSCPECNEKMRGPLPEELDL